jgi:hypothetical protein
VPGFDPATYTNVACLFQPTSGGYAGIGCYGAAAIRSGRALSSDSGTVAGLVPDGVARVRLVRGGQSTEAAVENNLFVSDRTASPSRVDWLAADGSLVERIDLRSVRRPPTP